MEEIVGVDQIRPKLGKYIKETAEGSIFIITSRSKPQGVLISYQEYEELKKSAEKAMRNELKAEIDLVREKAEAAGLIEADIKREIEEARSCE